MPQLNGVFDKMNSKKVMILVSIIFMDILGGAEVDLFIPSFPEIQAVFQVSPFLLEMLLSVNFLGFCISLFFIGALADKYGSKIVIMISLLIFIVGSIFCLNSFSFSLMIFGRLLQGIGAAAPSALGFVILANLYTYKQQQFLTGILNGIINISIAIAPVIGSYVALNFHWKGNFWALLFLGILALALTFLFIPKDKRKNNQDNSSFKDFLPILKSDFLLYNILFIVFSYSHWWVFIGSAPILYMESLGVTLNQFGYYQGSLAFVYALGSIAYSFLINRFDKALLMKISIYFIILSFGAFILITIFDTRSPLLITIILIIFNIALVVPTTSFYLTAINYMPESKGKIASLMQAMRLIVSGVSLQLVGYLYDGSFRTLGLVITFINIIGIIFMFLTIRHKKYLEQ